MSVQKKKIRKMEKWLFREIRNGKIERLKLVSYAFMFTDDCIQFDDDISTTTNAIRRARNQPPNQLAANATP